MKNYEENYNDLINEYLYIANDKKEITIDERIAILVSKLKSKNIEGMEYLSYIIKLKEILFTEQERNDNIKFAIIKDNEVSDLSEIDMLSGILTVNKKDFIKNPEYNLYYYLNSNTGVLPISQTNLQERFNEQLYEYISDDENKIPGIKEIKSLKK